jgi:hypothetical protein
LHGVAYRTIKTPGTKAIICPYLQVFCLFFDGRKIGFARVSRYATRSFTEEILPIVFASSSFYRRFARSLDASLHDSQPLDGWHGVRIIHPDVRL